MLTIFRTRFAVSPLVARTAPLWLVVLASACAPARADGVRHAPVEAARSPTTAAAAGGVAKPADTSLLAWMEGHWVGSQDGIAMEEHWSSPSGGALIGMHKDVNGERMTSFEFMRIEPTAGDGLTFFASPRSAPVTPFVLVELADQRAVFENKAHDFPQRILYWLDPAGALHARIEGTVKASPQAEEWTWTKKRR